MSSAPWVVHPHWHPRRTGVTRHVEAILFALGPSWTARAWGGPPLGHQAPRVQLRDIVARARREKVVWHAHRNNELLLGLLLKRLAPRLRLAFTRHGGRPPGLWTRFLMRRADRLVSLTPEMATQLPAPSTVVSHGVDLARFHPPEDRAASWRELGPGGEQGVGVVGRIRPDKGQEDFARAWALSRLPEWRAVLVGAAAPRHRAFLGRVREVGGEGLVAVAEQADIAPWYRGLTVLVQPSHLESYSLVLLEAMASGCCVVAAEQPHYARWIRHGENGLLYPAGDVSALAGHLEALFRAPAEAMAIGKRAAEWAQRHVGLDREASALSELYASLVAD